VTPFCREVDKHLRRILPPLGYRPDTTDPEETWIQWVNPSTGHVFRMLCDEHTDVATIEDAGTTYPFAPGEAGYVARLNATVATIAKTARK
jgi:hypothetical protein